MAHFFCIPVKPVLDLIGEREYRTKKMKPGFLLEFSPL